VEEELRRLIVALHSDLKKKHLQCKFHSFFYLILLLTGIFPGTDDENGANIRVQLV
jgi:hypothetical protein